jgi:hypothetical protein
MGPRVKKMLALGVTPGLPSCTVLRIDHRGSNTRRSIRPRACPPATGAASALGQPPGSTRPSPKRPNLRPAKHRRCEWQRPELGLICIWVTPRPSKEQLPPQKRAPRRGTAPPHGAPSHLRASRARALQDQVHPRHPNPVRLISTAPHTRADWAGTVRECRNNPNR